MFTRKAIATRLRIGVPRHRGIRGAFGLLVAAGAVGLLTGAQSLPSGASPVRSSSSCVSAPKNGIWTGTWASTNHLGFEGTWTQTLTVTGIRAPFSLNGVITVNWTGAQNVVAGAASTGSSSGPLTGTVTCTGQWTVTAAALQETYSGSASPLGTSASGTYLLPVIPGVLTDYGTWSGAVTPLSITTVSLPAATRGVAYNAPLTATSGTPPYRWKKFGQLPAGLKVSSVGVVIGTPSMKLTPGTYSLSVEVLDHARPKDSSTKTFTITIS